MKLRDIKLEAPGFVCRPFKQTWEWKLNEVLELRRRNGHIKVPHFVNGTRRMNPLTSRIYLHRVQTKAHAHS